MSNNGLGKSFAISLSGDKRNFVGWKDAEGGSLHPEHHEFLDTGNIICVEKLGSVKLFRKTEGKLMSKSLIKSPGNSPESLIKNELGEYTKKVIRTS